MIKIIKLRLRNLDNKHLKKAGGHISQNIVEIKIKDDDNSLKTLNDKNHQALSQKFRQLIPHKSYTHIILFIPRVLQKSLI